MNFSKNSLKVMERRYLLKNEKGEAIETPEEMFNRVANHVAQLEKKHDGNVADTAAKFYDLMADRRFFPNSPTFTGAGTPLGQLAACFVLPLADDMGKDPDGIFNTLRNAALIQQTGGGNGFSFSRLRPKGDIVHASNGKASGPTSFLRAFDGAFNEVHQGGVRRGANMAVLHVSHPDIEEFIECKSQEGDIANFNISVAISDAFMQAVRQDSDFNLVNPRDGEVWKKVRARDLWSKIVRNAHRNGEPGVLFIDAANRSNPVPHLYDLEATNPCGEQWLGPYENCCLGSVNLAQHVNDDGVDWLKLADTVRTATHFLDNVVDANAYVPAVPQLREAALKARRIGLGFMGLADMMYMLGIRYGSEEGQEFAAQITEFIRYICMDENIALAKERGPFPAFEGSIYDDSQSGEIKWQPPKPVTPYTRDFGRPDLVWGSITDYIKHYGIRNAAQTTVAPTGTIATVCGTEGYGCEPVFALGYTRHFQDGEKDVELHYTSPLFEAALDQTDLSESDKQAIKKHVAEHGSCQGIVDLPSWIRNFFVVSSDITAEEHVRMQASIQAFIDNSLSKTCNFPTDATEQDVADAYMLGWELGCKGMTVYVTGSRDKVVLETKATQQAKTPTAPRKRPAALTGTTYRKQTPLGNAYVTINEDDSGNPFEVFLNVGKAGSETAAVSEGIGRIISLFLRSDSNESQRERLSRIADELTNIGSGSPLGLGAKRVRSLVDGIGQVLSEYLQGETDSEPTAELTAGDLCPECGEPELRQSEGCATCAACGYSKC